MSVMMKAVALSAWVALFLLFLVETKMYFRIDIIPDVNTPVDDIYHDVQHDIANWYRNL